MTVVVVLWSSYVAVVSGVARAGHVEADVDKYAVVVAVVPLRNRMRHCFAGFSVAKMDSIRYCDWNL